MTAFFRRLKFAFWTLFAILFKGRIPDPVLAALAPSHAPAGAGDAAHEVAAPPEATPAERPAEATAVQMLAVLQRDGRLIDFLMEDIAAYQDAQIGAAVRNVHAGCRQALQRYLTLAPAFDGPEGGTVTVPAGTDPAMVKPIGNVRGGPPLSGILQHRGWIVSRIELPTLPPTGQFVIAPAEVEVA